ncbi:MAG: transposase [Deltaproteobacteria bacterium]|nr:transposase [Deltaproteobacteria bacterium]MBW1939578.1 transposase [Deltaproteobacteria bacterium]MBW2079720.1 transposase [Deltaproteobacteria bacterium]
MIRVQSDSNAFLWFLTQLRQRTPEHKIVIILDNASIHRSKKVKNTWIDTKIFIYFICLPILLSTIR